MSDLAVLLLKKYKAERDRSIEILMVSVRYDLLALHQTEQLLKYLKFHPSLAIFFYCRAAQSFVHKPDKNLKRLNEGLRNNFCVSL